MRSGAQLYTVRAYCGNTDALSETLKKIADIGYTTVQLSGVCACDPDWMAEELKKNGLICALTHYDGNKIRTEPEKTVEDHKKFGCGYVGIGCMPGGLHDPEDYDRFVSGYKEAAKRIAAAGAYFMYHNHHMEFMRAADGRLYIEKLADAFKPEEMGFTLDTYWVQYGGGDPAQWIEKLSGRVPCIHLKDMACVDRQPRMAVVGEGNINFDRVLEKAEAAGTKYLLVEQDDCYGEDPFECLKRSYLNLKAMGIE